MGPLREIPPSRLPTIRLEDIRPINEQVMSLSYILPVISFRILFDQLNTSSHQSPSIVWKHFKNGNPVLGDICSDLLENNVK